MPGPNESFQRSLYGYPVVVSTALPENTGLIGDFRDSALLYQAGPVNINWSEHGGDDDFAHNLVRFRAEGGYGVAVLRSFAFIEVNLGGTGS